MKKRLVAGVSGVLLLLAVAAAAALYLGNRREVTTSSEAAYRLYQEALLNERRFYFREAREGFAKALELDPQFAEAMLGLARRTEGDQGLALVQRAAKQRDRLTERERMHVDMQLANRERRLDDALKMARAIHEKYPDDTRAAMALASHELLDGNTEKAVQIWTDLLAVEPNNADAYNQLGYYYAYRGDYDKAIENLHKYQFMAPDQANPYDSLGEIQAYSGHYDEAIENLNRALKLKPDFYEAYRHLGVVYEGKGEYAKAVQSYRKGAEEAPSDEMRRDLYRSGVRAAFRGGDAATVRELLAKQEALPKNKYAEIDAAAREAVLAMLDGKPAQAESVVRSLKPKLEGLLAKEENSAVKKFYDPAWSYLLARALVAQGKTQEALPVLEEMANPPKAWVNFEERRFAYEGRALLAEILARRGDLDRAEKLLAENRKWNPSWAPTRASEQVVAQLRREKVLAASK
jgi:tetratricopeptide (TPR) repeat protein